MSSLTLSTPRPVAEAAPRSKFTGTLRQGPNLQTRDALNLSLPTRSLDSRSDHFPRYSQKTKSRSEAIMICPYSIPRLRKVVQTSDKRSQHLTLGIISTLIVQWTRWNFTAYAMIKLVPVRSFRLRIDTLMARRRGSVSRSISRLSMNSQRFCKDRILMVHPSRLKLYLTPRTNLAGRWWAFSARPK